MAEKGAGSVYADSSFLISLYSPDAHTAAAGAAMKPLSGRVTITPLVELEVINGFQQRVFWKQVAASEAQNSLHYLQADIENQVLLIRALPDSLFARAKQIAEQTTSTPGTHALDLLHVAAAIELGAESLYSFDDRQRRLAKTLRLKLNRLA